MLSVRLDSLRREGQKFSIILCKDIMKLFWSNGPTKSLSSFFETHPPLRLSRSHPLAFPPFLSLPSYFDSRMTENFFPWILFRSLLLRLRPRPRARPPRPPVYIMCRTDRRTEMGPRPSPAPLPSADSASSVLLLERGREEN